MHSFFRRFAHATSVAVGTPWAFFLAVSVVAVWAITGPSSRYSDRWQARNRLVALEEMSDEELERSEREFHQLHVEAGQVRRMRGSTTSSP